MSPVSTSYHQSSNKILKMSADFQLPHLFFSFLYVFFFVSSHGREAAYFWNNYQETAFASLFSVSTLGLGSSSVTRGASVCRVDHILSSC